MIDLDISGGAWTLTLNRAEKANALSFEMLERIAEIASDAKAAGPLHEGFKPEDVAASFFHSLGIDHQKEFHTSIGRPIHIVRDGSVIPELFS